jgi:hypothetical protein
MIKIDANKTGRTITNFWNHIHFHPTDAIEDDWGREILDRCAADGATKSVRMYTMFEDIVSMDENGNLKVFDVYLGVDREIFKGDFAMTNAAERQQALTGETWDWGSAGSRSLGVSIGYIVASAVDVAIAGTSIGIAVKNSLMASAREAANAVLKEGFYKGFADAAARESANRTYETLVFAHEKFKLKWAGVGSKTAYASVALTLII